MHNADVMIREDVALISFFLTR